MLPPAPRASAPGVIRLHVLGQAGFFPLSRHPSSLRPHPSSLGWWKETQKVTLEWNFKLRVGA